MIYIDGTNASTLGNITVLDVTYGTAQTTYYKEWLKQSKHYIFRDMESTYSTSTVKLLIKASNVELQKTISNVVSLARHAVIAFDDRPFGIDGTLTSVSENKINPSNEVITLEFEGMKVSNSTSTVTFLNGTTFTPDGNLPCAFVMTITPSSDISSMSMVLNGESFKFSSLSANMTYTFDTEKGLFTDASGTNVFTKFTGWELPYLIGGKVNLVSLDVTPTINVTYRGRWA